MCRALILCSVPSISFSSHVHLIDHLSLVLFHTPLVNKCVEFKCLHNIDERSRIELDKTRHHRSLVICSAKCIKQSGDALHDLAHCLGSILANDDLLSLRDHLRIVQEAQEASLRLPLRDGPLRQVLTLDLAVRGLVAG